MRPTKLRLCNIIGMFLSQIVGVLLLDPYVKPEFSPVYPSPNPYIYGRSIAYKRDIYFFQDRFSEKGRPHVLKFSLESRSWSWLNSTGLDEDLLARSALVVFRDKVYLFGRQLTMFTSNMQVYSVESGTWSYIPYSDPWPSVRLDCYMFVYNDKIYLHGGLADVYLGPETDFGDLWSYDADDKEWAVVIRSDGMLKNLIHPSKLFYNGSLYVLSNNRAPSSQQQFIYILDMRTLTQNAVRISIVFQPYASLFACNSKLCTLGFNSTLSNPAHMIRCFSLDNWVMNEYPNTLSCTSSLCLPLKTPMPRAKLAIHIIDDEAILVGGESGYKVLTDLWILNLTSIEWIWSSMNVFPLDRTEPAMVKINETAALMYGGKHYDPFTMIMNDLWIFDIDSNSWALIKREHYCDIEDGTCAPQVFHSAIGYLNRTLYIIGGETVKETLLPNPLFRAYDLDRNLWRKVLFQSPPGLQSIGYLVSSAYTQQGSTLWISHGLFPPSMNSNFSVEVYTIDFESMMISHIPATGRRPPPRTSAKVMFNGGRLCLYGGISTYVMNYLDYWCLSGGDWSEQSALSMPRSSSKPHPIIDFGSLILFVSLERFVKRPQLYIYRASAWNVFAFTPSPSVDPDVVLQFGTKLFIMATFRAISFQATFSVYDMANYFCDPVSENSVVSSMILSDGSGDFNYFPGTSCRWKVSGANWVQIEAIDIGDDVSLTVESQSCPEVSLNARDELYEKLQLSNQDTGRIFGMASNAILISFQVPAGTLPRQGFRLKLVACSLGFILQSDGCRCPPSSVIAISGECIPVTVNAVAAYSDMIDLRMEGASSTLFQPSWSFYLGSAVFWNGRALLWNGLSYNDKSKGYSAIKEGYLLETNIEGAGFKSSLVRMKGFIPPARFGSCIVEGGHGAAYMFGGVSLSSSSELLYKLNLTTYEWAYEGIDPFYKIEAPVCLRVGNMVHVIGGMRDKAVQVLHSVVDLDTMTLLDVSNSTTGTPPAVSHACGAFYNDAVFIFGGFDGKSVTGILWKYSIEHRTWQSMGLPKLATCIQTRKQIPITQIARSEHSCAQRDRELHIFGGRQGPEILNTVVIIDLETLELLYMESALNIDDVALMREQGRAGASVVTVGAEVFIFGGDLGNRITAPDLLVWNTDYRAWRFSSSRSLPLPRWGASIVMHGNNSIVMFGGAVTSRSNTFSNDLWNYDPVSNSWSLWSEEALQGRVPSPRIQCVIESFEEKIYIFGGQLRHGFSDPLLWKFDIARRLWTSYNLQSNGMSANLQPHRRAGMAHCMTENKRVVLYGGEDVDRGTVQEGKHIAFGLDLVSARLSIVSTDSYGPNSITSSCMSCFSSLVYLLGGDIGIGYAEFELWQLHPDNGTWVQLHKYQNLNMQTVSIARWHNHFYVFCTSTVCGGNQVWVVDTESRESAVLRSSMRYLEERIIGFDVISIGSQILMLEGKGPSGPNRNIDVFEPATCSSSTVQRVNGTMAWASFGDGSQRIGYFGNLDCRWEVMDSSIMRVSYCLHESDSLQISSIHKERDELEFNNTFTGCGVVTVEQSKGGFVVILRAKRTNNTPGFGFLIEHAGL
eukprot:TRINITY_DN8139_c0_g1_i4.p1 TRINITY_DN8139_c0_g1~~TRINITY_DN8139_c0_g1_i4.p1  ORF type:complete len:1576 (-),score=202.66 TRINITY_DN8139_c0_g1_i4:2950-7677(-)